MKIYGVDFTSAPKRDKPIVVADCDEVSGGLVLKGFIEFSDWPAFGQWLKGDSEWIAGFDFPFGLPRRFVKRKAWPENTWADMVEACVREGKDRFVEDAMRAFQQAREKEDKHRATDLVARSESPLKTKANPPVGRMFYEGAWRLVDSKVNVLGLRETKSRKIAVEAFPGLAVSRFGERYYKNDKAASAEANLAARKRLVECMRGKPNPSQACTVSFNSRSLAERMMHASGDWLDAVLCAMQAHWGWVRREQRFGLPRNIHPVEGWIISA